MITPTAALPNLHQSLGERLGNLVFSPALVQITPELLSTVCIVVPLSWDFVPKKFHISLLHLQRGGGPVVYVNADTIYKMRNQGVRRAREHGSKWVLMLDADMDFPAHTLARLLSHGKPIVGGLCRGRREPFAATIWQQGPDGKLWQMSPMEGGLRRVSHTGGACLLISMEVFDKLDELFPRQPYFVNRECWEEDCTEANQMSEDFWFCEQARKAGYEVYVDQDLKIGHITTAIITDDAQHCATVLLEKGFN